MLGFDNLATDHREIIPGTNLYGYYDAANREYVITRPDTPTPWVNYLGQGDYGGIISNTGGGFSFHRDPRNRRVSRYRYNALPPDQPGRYIYLRREDSGEYWGVTWQPVRAPLDAYQCRHGAGYTKILTERAGIQAAALYFVPPSAADSSCPVELWALQLKNTSATPLVLRAFSYVELSFVDAYNDLSNLDWAMHVMSSQYDPERRAILARTKFSPTTQFFACSEAPAGFDCDRERFVGAYRGLENPVVVELGRSGGTEAPRGNNIGSFHHEFTLEPGVEATMVYILGITDDATAIGGVVERFSDLAEVQRSFAALRSHWDKYLQTFQVQLPDDDASAMANFWGPVQCRTTLYWSRFVSSYETGLGRGVGTRDTAQDTLGVVHAVPDEVAAKLSRLWALQFSDGHTWHQFFPLTGEGGPGLASERPSWPQWFCDDHLWLVIATCAYLKETGDYGYLERQIPYADDGLPEGRTPAGRGSAAGSADRSSDGAKATKPKGPLPRDGHGDPTIWGHIMAAIDFTLSHRGPHSLPRAGFADWDDTLNVDHGSGLAESVWCAMQFCRAALDLAELASFLGRTGDAASFREMHGRMAQAVNDHAWDGHWYVRCFDDAGKAIGGASEDRHRINLIPQSWSVIGEVTPRPRGEAAMASAHELLGTAYGPILMWPPYDGGDPRVNGTSTYPPGAKENGGIFCHAAAWSVIAAAHLGDGDRAYGYLRQLLPLSRPDVQRSSVEPYVYCQNICGPSHPQYGLGRNSWLTGAASWMQVAITQWILGIRPTHTGLRIRPALPSAWPGYSARRWFRGTEYRVTVTRGGPGGAISLLVDGKRVPGDVVPLAAPGTATVAVDVVVGGE